MFQDLFFSCGNEDCYQNRNLKIKLGAPSYTTNQITSFFYRYTTMIWIHTLYLVVLCLIPQVIAPPPPPPNALQIHTIRAAYNELGARVSQTLHLQLGDISCIDRQRSNVQQFLEAVQPVCCYILINKTPF